MGDEIDVVSGTIVISAGNRTKASKLRRKVKGGESLSPEEAAWLDEYEQVQRRTDMGPSARAASTSRKVSYTSEESQSAAESHGEGSVAFVAASAAVAREEGRRLDFLASAGLQAFNLAFGRVLEMNKQLLERNLALENAHVDLMNAVTKGHIDLTAAEIDNMRAEAEHENQGPGGIEGMVKELLPVLLNEMSSRMGPGKKLPK